MILQATRDLNHASLAKASGSHVEIHKQAGGRRVVYYIPDTPEINQLLEKYERRELLPLPAKCILNAKTTLYHMTAAVLRGDEI